MVSEEDRRLEALKKVLDLSKPNKVKFPTTAMPETGFKRKKINAAKQY